MVDRDSAIVFTAKEIIVGADADHFEIAKIKQSQAGIFSHVKSAIHRALRPTVSLAEDHQRMMCHLRCIPLVQQGLHKIAGGVNSIDIA
ncbi:hypothetical protein COL922a_011947 [Colletotrichum nupharicola]|nr:hypothetical protein COL922a_011947 [Colletotrichum nupharicola]